MNTQFLYNESDFRKFIETYSQQVVITDTNTNKFCLPRIKNLLWENAKIINIEAGEEHKNFQSLQYILSELIDNNLGKNTAIINLGGGVISDLGGFAASIYKRGIDSINIPTSLLSMVDASFGGKTGINYSEIKNIIGTFHHPKLVYINPDFLQTLPHRQILCGFAEMLKHGLIHDKEYFFQLTNFNKLPENWMPNIQKSIQIKQEIVSKDPYDEGLRKILNAGHTIGHALEMCCEDLLHGEAVAWGLLAETRLALQLNLIDHLEYSIIEQTIQHFYSYCKPSSINIKDCLNKMKHDKKNQLNSYNFSLLESIGKSQFNHSVNLDENLLGTLLNF